MSALQVQIGIIASNSNEILRLNGLTLAALGQTQASSILPQFVLQPQQSEVLLAPQLVNLNPQIAGPFNPQVPQLFLPNQANQFTPMLIPNGQPEQLGPPQDTNHANGPQQALNPVQMFPHFQYQSYGYPLFPRQQGFGYFVPPYGYPQQGNAAVMPPNSDQQVLERPAEKPQLPLQVRHNESTTPPPDPRGDTFGPGIDEV
uniref:Uncharacterized protein n=1 Tax=Mola mola TaxID=94237 RepID=A0A3Q3VZW2_MOLML